MNIFFAPYGSFSQETGLMALFARYLQSKNKETSWLTCNGALGACDRDEEVSWIRTHTTCLSCMADARRMSSWIGCKVNEITTSAASDSHQRPSVEFQEIQESFTRRFGITSPEDRHLGHDSFKARLEVGATRVKYAVEKLCATYPSVFLFIASGMDFASRAAFSGAEISHAKAAVFQWSIKERGVKIFHPVRKEILSCSLVLADISRYRTNVDSWSKEVIEILTEIEEFLGV